MKLWLIVIKDKELLDEPDVGVAILETDDVTEVDNAGTAMLEKLRERGRCRCTCRRIEIERGQFYRSSMWFRPPAR